MKTLITTIVASGLIAFTGISQTWSPQNTNTNRDLESIFFVDSCTGWALGKNGTVIKTTSRGGSWFSQDIANQFDIKGSYFHDNMSGVAVGKQAGVDGFIMRTSDGGFNWIIDSMVVEKLEDVWFVNTQMGWTCGRNGYVAYTADGGVTWTNQNTGSGEDLQGIHFETSLIGWAVGSGGEIIKTANGGASWINQNSPTNEDFESVFFVNELKGWAVARTGKIAYTDNGGTTWTPQNSGTTGNLLDVWFADSLNGWIGCNGGELLVTNDGGINWNTDNSGTVENIKSVHMLTPDLGWLCANSGEDCYYGILDALHADFSTNLTTVCLGDSSFFTDLSTGPPNSWSWNFGDGNTSNLASPGHLYTAIGTYNVVLSVSNATDCIDTLPMVINVVAGPPVSAFTTNMATACEGQQIDFFDASTSFPSTWSWNFGDGNGDNAENPNHSYLVAGTYTVSLTTSNNCGQGTLTQGTITIITAPIAAFSSSQACEGDTTFFTDASTAATSWIWDYGDATVFGSIANPTHIYGFAGNYPVNLTVSNGACTDILSQNVNVLSLPTASFSSSTVCLGFSTLFIDLSTAGVLIWDWDFSDGNTSGNQNPNNTFVTAGTHLVSLSVTDGNGCVGTTQQSALVNEANVQSNPSVISICAVGDTAVLIAAGGVSYVWSPATGLNTTIGDTVLATPTASQQYIVSGTDVNGCVDSAIVDVTLDATAVATASFAASDNDGCSFLTVSFTNNSTLATGYLWSFPGGTPNSSTEVNPVVTYSSVGVFDVDLTAYGCAANDIMANVAMITVSSPVASGFTQATDTLNLSVGSTVVFTDASSANANAWMWDFGNSTTSTNQNPTGTYSAVGTYTISLTSYNGACTDMSFSTLVVIDGLSIAKLNIVADFLKTYPNPVNDLMIIDLQLKEMASYRFFDNMGKLVQQGNLQPGINQVSVNEFATGLYIYYVSSKSGTSIVRGTFMKN